MNLPHFIAQVDAFADEVMRQDIAAYEVLGALRRNPRTASPFRLEEETIVDTATSLEAVGALG
jgi:hypothetical protein